MILALSSSGLPVNWHNWNPWWPHWKWSNRNGGVVHFFQTFFTSRTWRLSEASFGRINGSVFLGKSMARIFHRFSHEDRGAFRFQFSRAILHGYKLILTSLLVFSWEYLRSPAKNWSFFAGITWLIGNGIASPGCPMLPQLPRRMKCRAISDGAIGTSQDRNWRAGCG